MDNTGTAKLRSTLFSLLLGCGLLAALLFLKSFEATPAADAATLSEAGTTGSIHYVAPGASCGGSTPCYGSLQSAVDAAASGDEVRVAAGIYVGTGEQVVLIEKGLTIRGGYTTSNWGDSDPDANGTVLDGENARQVVRITGPVTVVLEGFEITRGSALRGGGVRVDEAEVLLKDNLIQNNRASAGAFGSAWGGGVYLDGADGSVLVDNVIASNQVFPGSAGVGRGGGVSARNTALALRGNTIRGNVAHMFVSSAGGGLYFEAGEAAFLDGALLDNRSNDDGGGLFLDGGVLLMARSVVSGNEATIGSGGGLYVGLGDTQLTNVVVRDNQAAESGTGIGIAGDGSGSAMVEHATLADNQGGDGAGIAISSASLVMTNTVVVSQTVGITVGSGATATVRGVLWHANSAANVGGAGTIDVEGAVSGAPAFAADGYHLTVGSAAVDQGVEADLFGDIDREPRWDTPDLGADELWLPGELKRTMLPLVVRVQ